MPVILLNFLIAVISQTYERVSGSKDNYTYKDRAEMNKECSIILKALSYQGEVKMIVFSEDKNIWSQENNVWSGFVESIRRAIR